MNVNLEIPDDLVERLAATGRDLSRDALEGFAPEEYKAGRIAKAELRRWLGFDTRYKLDVFLRAHDVWENFTMEDIRQDARAPEKSGILRRGSCRGNGPINI